MGKPQSDDVLGQCGVSIISLPRLCCKREVSGICPLRRTKAPRINATRSDIASALWAGATPDLVSRQRVLPQGKAYTHVCSRVSKLRATVTYFRQHENLPMFQRTVAERYGLVALGFKTTDVLANGAGRKPQWFDGAKPQFMSDDETEARRNAGMYPHGSRTAHVS